MHKVITIFIALGTALAPLTAPGAGRPLTKIESEKVRSAIKDFAGEGVAVDQVSVTPIPGLYEVVSGSDIFYSDASGRFALVDGRLMDLQTKIDLTQRSIDRLNRVDFNTLPLHLAMKKVQGDGRRVIAIFEDPTCPICKVLHKFIAQLPDLTVYTFPFPIASAEALPLARSIWCNADRSAAWELAMAGTMPKHQASCDTSSIDVFVALGEKLKIAGTPTVILSNGRRLVGALPPDQFVDAIDQLGSSNQ